jgi:hypothetical protein
MENFRQRLARAVKAGFRAMQAHRNVRKEEWHNQTLDAWLPPSDQLPDKLLLARNRAIMTTCFSFERRLGSGNWQLKSALCAFGTCAALAFGKVLQIGVHEWRGVLLWLGFGIVAGLVRESVKLQIVSILSFEEGLEEETNPESQNYPATGDGRIDETALRNAVSEALGDYRGNSKFSMFWPGSGKLSFHQNVRSLVALFSQELWFRMASTICLVGAVVCLALELPVKW